MRNSIVFQQQYHDEKPHFKNFILNQNELVLEDGKIGFQENSENTIEFLSVERIDRLYIEDIEGETKDYPFFSAGFGLGPNKTLSTRKSYNFMDVLGDFGGFNESLFLIIGSLSLFYSSRLFKASVAQELSY